MKYVQMLNPNAYAYTYKSVEIQWNNIPYNAKILGFSIPVFLPNGNISSGFFKVMARYNLGNSTVGKIRIGDLELKAFRYQGLNDNDNLFIAAFLKEPFPLPLGFSAISLDIDADTSITQNQAYSVNPDPNLTYCFSEAEK
ncbi:MAG: hypothetical protein QXP36_07890 [Conexivisphaerales archaeon]